MGGTGIKYIVLEPDTSLDFIDNSPISRVLDLDNNKVDDFELILTRHNLDSRLEIKPLGMNSISACKSNNELVDSLRQDDMIDINNNWSDSTSLLYEYRYLNLHPSSSREIIYGFFFGGSFIHPYKGYYVGVKVSNGNNNLFGWIDVRGILNISYAITQPY